MPRVQGFTFTDGPTVAPATGAGGALAPQPGLRGVAEAVGNLAHVGRMIEDAEGESAANSAANRVASGLADLARDPELDEKTYLERVTGLVDAEAETVSSPRHRNAFRERADQARTRGLIAFRERDHARRLSALGAELDESVDALSGQIARSEDPAEEEELRAELARQVASSVERGVRTAEQARAMVVQAEQGEARALLVELQRSPETARVALEMLNGREDAFEHFSEEDRQRALTQTEGVIRVFDAQAAAQQRQAEEYAKKAQRLAREKANRELLALRTAGQLTIDEINARADELGKLEDVLRWTKEAEKINQPAGYDVAYVEELRQLAISEPRSYLALVDDEGLDPIRAGKQHDELLGRADEIRKAGRVPAGIETRAAMVTRRVDVVRLGEGDELTFRRRLNEEVEAFVERNGAEPDRAQFDAIMDGLLLPVDFGFFDPEDFRFELTEAEQSGLAGVPGELIAPVVATLEDQGREVTEEAIHGEFVEMEAALRGRGIPVSPATAARFFAIKRDLAARERIERRRAGRR